MNTIERLRIERDWSRAELARRTGMDASDLGRIERGIMRPYPGQILKLARAFGVTDIQIADEIENGV